MSDYWIGAEYWEPERAEKGLRTLRIVVATFSALLFFSMIGTVWICVNFFLGRSVEKPSSLPLLAFFILLGIGAAAISVYGVRALMHFYSDTHAKLKMAISGVGVEVKNEYFIVNSEDKSRPCIVNEKGLYIWKDITLFLKHLPQFVTFADLLVFTFILVFDSPILYHPSVWLAIIYFLAIFSPLFATVYAQRFAHKLASRLLKESSVNAPSISWSQVSSASIVKNLMEVQTNTQHGLVSIRLNRKARTLPMFEEFLSETLGDRFKG